MARKVKPKFEPQEHSGKQAALDGALAQIEKSFGKGAIMRFSDMEPISVSTISSGSLAIDLALGVGGFPRGRIIEIYGPESSGKTTLSLTTVAEAQKTGGLCAFVDAEHAFDPDYAKLLRVDLDNLLISQPDSGEQALEIVETLVRSNALDVIVIDSVAALVPRSELEGEMGDAQMGVQARLMSQALRKLTAIINKSKTIVIFLNQLRMKIGVMFGNPETTTGGMALKFYSSIRVEIRRGEQLKDGDKVIGNRVNVKIVKNKVAPPFRRAEFELLYAKGISKQGDLLDLGVQFEVLQKSGAWYIWGEEKIGQGRESARQYLIDHPEVATKLEAEIREQDKK